MDVSEKNYVEKTLDWDVFDRRWIITVWTVVQTVLTATFNNYGNRQISTPYKISTPEPIEKNSAQLITSEIQCVNW